MPRIRSIKPDFWADEIVGQLTPRARLLFIASWNLAEDSGALRWNPRYIKAHAFMYDDLPHNDVAEVMRELTEQGLLYPYETDRGEQLAIVVTFQRHQRIHKRAKLTLPLPAGIPDEPLDVPDFLRSKPETFGPDPETSGSVERATAPPSPQTGKIPSPRARAGGGGGGGGGKGEGGGGGHASRVTLETPRTSLGAIAQMNASTGGTAAARDVLTHYNRIRAQQGYSEAPYGSCAIYVEMAVVACQESQWEPVATLTTILDYLATNARWRDVEGRWGDKLLRPGWIFGDGRNNNPMDLIPRFKAEAEAKTRPRTDTTAPGADEVKDAWAEYEGTAP